MRKKSIVYSFLVVTLLAGLAACSSGLQPDARSVVEESSLATQATTGSYRVPNSASDAEEASSVAGYGSPVLELGEKTPGDRQTVGLRFMGVNVPKGANITSAYLEFTAVTDRSGTSSLTVYGIDVSDTPDFSGSNATISARPKTSARVPWGPGNWTDGQTYKSNSLVSIVKEITSRSDWAAGKAMGFSISGTGTSKASSYDGNSASAPKLVVTYDTAPPPPPPATSCLGSSPSTKIGEFYDGGSYRIRGYQGDVRFNATGLSVRSPKAQLGSNEARKAFTIANNKATSQNPVSVCLSGATVEVIGLAIDEPWQPYFHESGSFFISGSPGTIIQNVTTIRGGDGFTIKDSTSENAKIRDEKLNKKGFVKSKQL